MALEDVGEGLWLDLRDGNGERILHVPLAVVSVETARGVATLAAEVSLVGLVPVSEADPVPAPPNGAQQSTLADVLSAGTSRRDRPFGKSKRPRQSPVARQARREIDRRDAEIRRMRDEGVSLREIALRVGLSDGQVSRIASGRRSGNARHRE